MFIVSLKYKQPLETVDAHLQEHGAYLKEQHAAGWFLISGRKVPRTGGVILVTAPSRESLETVLERDPFHIHQIADYEVIEFRAGMTYAELEFLKNK